MLNNHYLLLNVGFGIHRKIIALFYTSYVLGDLSNKTRYKSDEYYIESHFHNNERVGIRRFIKTSYGFLYSSDYN